MPPPTRVPQRPPTEPLPEPGPSQPRPNPIGDFSHDFGGALYGDTGARLPSGRVTGVGTPRGPPQILSVPSRRPPVVASSQLSSETLLELQQPAGLPAGLPITITPASLGTHSAIPEGTPVHPVLPPASTHAVGMHDPLTSLPFHIDASQIDPQLMMSADVQISIFAPQSGMQHPPPNDLFNGGAGNVLPESAKPRRGSRKRSDARPELSQTSQESARRE